MWQTLKNPVGAQGLRPKATFLIKNLLKGDRNFLQNLFKGDRNSLKSLLEGDRNSPLLKMDQSLDEPNPNPLTFA
jgi:hypothetical protein